MQSEEEAFLAHIRAVAAEVQTWPRWKQLVLGTFPSETPKGGDAPRAINADEPIAAVG
jgi:hypothetical protein